MSPSPCSARPRRVFRNEFSLSGSSKQAQDLLEERGFDAAGFSGQIVFTSDRGVNDPTVRQTMEQLFARGAHGAAHAGSEPYTPEGARQISESGRIAYGEVNFADRPDKEFQGAADKVKPRPRT